jgi:hypothetical protein
MNDYIRAIFSGVSRFFAKASYRRLVYLVLLGLAALFEYTHSEAARRTFVFYTIDTGSEVLEDRMLARSASREQNITRYVEEALLGPMSPESAPLFPRETRLRSLLYRDGVVYGDLSEAAALAPPEGGELMRNLAALRAGILRNFAYIRDVRLFIAGREVFFE